MLYKKRSVQFHTELFSAASAMIKCSRLMAINTYTNTKTAENNLKDAVYETTTSMIQYHNKEEWKLKQLTLYSTYKTVIIGIQSMNLV
jgi:hypothetical protein